MKKSLLLAVFAAFSLAAAPATFRPYHKIAKVKGLALDTGIDHPAWKSAPSYRLMKLVYTIPDINRKPLEAGFVQYLYDDKYLYIRADFADSDIMTNAAKDGGHFYKQGDLLEIFIKPGNANYYWEIYATPNDLQTRFHFGSRSTVGLPSGFAHKDVGIKIVSRLNGTLNNPMDRDKGYILLVAIPIAELNRPHAVDGVAEYPAGTVPFAPGNDWRIQSARYNYGRYLRETELSCNPQAYGGYHSTEYYAQIELEK